MEPIWRNRLIVTAAVFAGIVVSFLLASEDVFAVLALALLLVALIVSWVTDGLLGPLILAATLVGYVVGNRGFAQISLLKSLPLLPAEIALGATALLVILQGASQRRLPIAKDFLSIGILVWCILSSIRLGPDLRTYGVLALRDYATVYYAFFYFIAFFLAEEPRGRKVIVAGLSLSTVLLAPMFFFAQLAPEVVGRLTFRGVPLIFYKPDLVSAFAAIGIIWAYAQAAEARGWHCWAWRLVFIANLALIGYTVGRATMFATAIGGVLLLLAREWKFIAQLVLVAFTLGCASIAITLLAGQSFEKTKVYSVYEHLISITDLNGDRTYEVALDSAENNQFRLVWWRSVIMETLKKAPLTGQGWGYDLGEPFVREYFGDRPDDFSARSPHNIFLTVFGRVGLIGLAAFALFVAAFTRRVFQAMRMYSQHDVSIELLGLWVMEIVIFVCACLGIVLEGPMGAVIFWTILGVANADFLRSREEKTAELPDGDAAQATRVLAS